MNGEESVSKEEKCSSIHASGSELLTKICIFHIQIGSRHLSIEWNIPFCTNWKQRLRN